MSGENLTPITRKEMFLAKAAGMDVETPSPITREEMFLSKISGSSGGGGGSLEGFHMVRFFNDDQTTLLYTVFVPTGADVIYAGETPVSTESENYVFLGFEPSATNVTADLDCYAVYSEISTLDQTSWAAISTVSDGGIAQNYFAVGDTKMIHIEGTVGTLAVNADYGVYIIGFDHNEELEGKGIHFGTFKGADGTDLCLVDSKYDKTNNLSTKNFNMNHWGSYNHGGWAGCDLRYDILGSTDVAPSNYGSVVASGRIGYDASETCATSPVANTLMAALPSDLRAVMKPMTKYTDNVGGSGNTAGKVTATIDYLPYLAEFEIFGNRVYANSAEQNKQKQYDYFAAGNNMMKYCHSNTITAANWYGRSPYHTASSGGNNGFCYVSKTGYSDYHTNIYNWGLAPIFKV